MSLRGIEYLAPEPPVGPPNQWINQFGVTAFDKVTGDPHIDRQIAINRGLYPRPWWRRIFGGGTDSMGAR